MKAGKEAKGKGSEWIKIAVSIVGVVLIAIAEKEIEEALANINQRLKDAEKEEEYQITFNQLTYQLLALQNTKVVLASLNADAADVYSVFARAAQWFRDRQSDLNAIVEAGAPSDQVNDVSLKAYSKAWQTLRTAGTNWQYMEVAKPVTNTVTLAGFGKAPESASAGG